MNGQNLNIALNLALMLAQNLAQLNGLIREAHNEGRDITDEELQQAVSKDDAARDHLAQVIARG